MFACVPIELPLISKRLLATAFSTVALSTRWASWRLRRFAASKSASIDAVVGVSTVAGGSLMLTGPLAKIESILISAPSFTACAESIWAGLAFCLASRVESVSMVAAAAAFAMAADTLESESNEGVASMAIAAGLAADGSAEEAAEAELTAAALRSVVREVGDCRHRLMACSSSYTLSVMTTFCTCARNAQFQHTDTASLPRRGLPYPHRNPLI